MARLRLCGTAAEGEQRSCIVADDAKALLALQAYERQEQANPCMLTGISVALGMLTCRLYPTPHTTLPTYTSPAATPAYASRSPLRMAIPCKAHILDPP